MLLRITQRGDVKVYGEQTANEVLTCCNNALENALNDVKGKVQAVKNNKDLTQEARYRKVSELKRNFSLPDFPLLHAVAGQCDALSNKIMAQNIERFSGCDPAERAIRAREIRDHLRGMPSAERLNTIRGNLESSEVWSAVRHSPLPLVESEKLKELENDRLLRAFPKEVAQVEAVEDLLKTVNVNRDLAAKQVDSL